MPSLFTGTTLDAGSCLALGIYSKCNWLHQKQAEGEKAPTVSLVRSNMAFAGDFTPVLAKHSKSFSLVDCISAGVDRMQRNFEPMRKQVEKWQQSELTDVTAKVVIYEAFVEGRLEAPKHLARSRNDLSSLTRHAACSRSDSRSWRRRAPAPRPEPGQGSPRTSILLDRIDGQQPPL